MLDFLQTFFRFLYLLHNVDRIQAKEGPFSKKPKGAHVGALHAKRGFLSQEF